MGGVAAAVIACGVLAVRAVHAWEYTISSADDLVCQGGAGCDAAAVHVYYYLTICTWRSPRWSKFGGEPNIRSGSPSSAAPSCRLARPANGKITSVHLSYKYAAGYGCTKDSCDNPPKFELWAQNSVR